jgi:hypothetical protein
VCELKNRPTATGSLHKKILKYFTKGLLLRNFAVVNFCLLFIIKTHNFLAFNFKILGLVQHHNVHANQGDQSRRRPCVNQREKRRRGAKGETGK